VRLSVCARVYVYICKHTSRCMNHKHLYILTDMIHIYTYINIGTFSLTSKAYTYVYKQYIYIYICIHDIHRTYIYKHTEI